MAGNKFPLPDFTYPINQMMQAKSEIMESPDICVLDGDYKNLACWELDMSDYNVLYKATVKQTSSTDVIINW